jgi:hypothetical protein
MKLRSWTIRSLTVVAVAALVLMVKNRGAARDATLAKLKFGTKLTGLSRAFVKVASIGLPRVRGW